ncbi:hypothetical protein ONZ45_g9448 [Pleurotus djamor]|nr:hypothetical protein ONZ45_g9448 [Pleurotus djamor]
MSVSPTKRVRENSIASSDDIKLRLRQLSQVQYFPHDEIFSEDEDSDEYLDGYDTDYSRPPECDSVFSTGERLPNFALHQSPLVTQSEDAALELDIDIIQSVFNTSIKPNDAYDIFRPATAANLPQRCEARLKAETVACLLSNSLGFTLLPVTLQSQHHRYASRSPSCSLREPKENGARAPKTPKAELKPKEERCGVPEVRDLERWERPNGDEKKDVECGLWEYQYTRATEVGNQKFRLTNDLEYTYSSPSAYTSTLGVEFNQKLYSPHNAAERIEAFEA